MNLENTEKLEKQIFGLSKFSVNNVIFVGNKGANDKKLNAIYHKDYASEKYSDQTELRSITVKTSDFITFKYNDFQNRINEEIFISYPHLPSFIEMLENAISLVTQDDMFIKKSVNPKYSEIVVESEPLGGGKKIVIFPTVIEDKDQKAKKGVVMLLASETVMVELDISTLIGVYNSLKDFNLYTNSALLHLTCLTYDNGIGGCSNTMSGTSTSTNTTSGTVANKYGKKNFSFGKTAEQKSPASKKFSGTRSVSSDLGDTTATVNTANLDDLDAIVDDKTFQPISEEEIVIEKTETETDKDDSPLSLDSILAGADSVENLVIDLDEEDL